MSLLCDSYLCTINLAQVLYKHSEIFYSCFSKIVDLFCFDDCMKYICVENELNQENLHWLRAVQQPTCIRKKSILSGNKENST